MVLRQRQRAHRGRAAAAMLVCALAAPFARAAAADPFDCHVELGNNIYDLTSLAGEHSISYTRETPPTTTTDEVRFDLCADLQQKSGVDEKDQCPPGTRACLTTTNHKGGNDRVLSVVPLAVTSLLSPEFTALSSPKGLSVVFHGSTYPSKTDPVPQSFKINLICDTAAAISSAFTYDGAQVTAEWRTPAGCDFSGPPGSPGSPDREEGGSTGEKKKVGSGIGWFFLLFLIAFGAYFALGAYYNYSTYGASGLDLIPNRDFWMDVPYLLRDVASHLCSAIRPTNRSGYIAV